MSLRIGTNHGSLSDRVMNRFGDTPEGMVESALEFVRICESLDFREIILSMKASNPKVMIAAYRLLVARMSAEGMDYPLHLGVTEAGNGDDARIKSATGIGSLLLDGLGDTIRVSLAEEPEAEIPVARQIAALCARPLAGPDAGAALRGDAPTLPYDPFHYRRRRSEAVALAGVTAGGEATIAVAGLVPAENAAALPAPVWRGAKAQRPELLIVELDDRADLARLEDLSWKGESPAPRALVAASRHVELLREALASVQAVRLTFDETAGGEAVVDLAGRAAADGVALWLELSLREAIDAPVAVAADLIAACAAAGQSRLIAGVRAAEPATVVHGTRLLAARLAAADLHCPIALLAPTAGDAMLGGAAALGSLLCDGIGDVAQAASVPLAFDLLQGAGARLTRTDYVACPSCGRTLFDLQTTTDRIKASTSHLQGVKIAVMGCVVNGPGEMADADFGYMGGSPGHVNLYVGKECMERGVPEEEADRRLIDLIRAHGRWIEPHPAGE